MKWYSVALLSLSYIREVKETWELLPRENAIFSLRASKPRFRADAESKEASGPVSRRPEAPADVLNLSSERGEERAVGRKAASSLPLAFVGAGNKARIEKVCGKRANASPPGKPWLCRGCFRKGCQRDRREIYTVEVKGAQVALDRHVALKIKMSL